MIHGITFLPQNLKIPFIRYRMINYALSAFMVLAVIGCFIFKGLNYGIDFKGGVMLEFKTKTPADIAKMRHDINALHLGEFALQEYGSSQDILIRLEHQKGGEQGRLDAIQKIKGTLGIDAELRRVETVGPKAGAELISNGLQAILWGLFAMLVYIWMRFEWEFGLCAIISLVHDAISVIGLYAIFGVEFNITAIVAVLTTIGYSINDTVVIYDRVRENLRKYKKIPLEEILDISINETLSRTILTSGSTLLALFGLYFFGGEVIATYSLPIIVGVAVGTYSSICVAAPLLLTFNLSLDRGEEKEKQTPANTPTIEEFPQK